QNDLDIAKAQLGLDQNELEDSMEDLARESGDQRIKLQQELAARQAEMKKYNAKASAENGKTAVIAATQFSTLAGQIRAWRAQRIRSQLIDQAETLAKADIGALTDDHARLEAEAQKIAAAVSAPGVGNPTAGKPGTSKVDQLQRMAE